MLLFASTIGHRRASPAPTHPPVYAARVLRARSDFAYTCQLDKQAFQQTVHTTTHSSGWNVGTTVKASAVFGVELLGQGGGAGPVAQFSFSYS